MKKNEDKRNYGKTTTKGFFGLFHSFQYAIKGLGSCFLQERNMRIHTFATIYVFFFGWIFHFDRNHFIVLAAICGLVVICEMFNTTTEMLCDLVSPRYDPMAGRLKDIAAGAVLVSSFIAILIGFFLFIRYEHLEILKEFFIDHPIRIAVFLFSLVFTWILIDGKWIHIIFGEKYEGEKYGDL